MKQGEFIPDYVWHRIPEAGSMGIGFISENQIRISDVATERICLLRRKNELLAFRSRCPHSGGPMVDAKLSPEGNLVCPWHRFEFCPRTGKNVSGEGLFLETFPLVIQEDGKVFVGMKRRKLFGLF